MKEIIEKLSKYGTVRSCKIVNGNAVTILLTKGFNQKAIDTFDFLKKCTELFPEHPILETCITESDLAFLVLTHKK